MLTALGWLLAVGVVGWACPVATVNTLRETYQALDLARELGREGCHRDAQREYERLLVQANGTDREWQVRFEVGSTVVMMCDEETRVSQAADCKLRLWAIDHVRPQCAGDPVIHRKKEGCSNLATLQNARAPDHPLEVIRVVPEPRVGWPAVVGGGAVLILGAIAAYFFKESYDFDEEMEELTSDVGMICGCTQGDPICAADCKARYYRAKEGKEDALDAAIPIAVGAGVTALFSVAWLIYWANGPADEIPVVMPTLQGTESIGLGAVWRF